MGERRSPDNPKTDRASAPRPVDAVGAAPRPAGVHASLPGERAAGDEPRDDAPTAPLHLDPEVRLRLRDRLLATLSDATCIGEVAASLLDSVGSALDAVAAELWMVDDDDHCLKPVHTWMSHAARGLKTRLFTRRVRLGRGEGLQGQVWESQQPAFIPDVFEGSDNRPIRHADETYSACAFPVRRLGGLVAGSAQGEVRGVLSFVGRHWGPPDPQLAAFIGTVGHQLIGFTETVRAWATFQESEDRFRRLGELSGEIIFRYRTRAPRGFEYVSEAIRHLTGYTPQELTSGPDMLERLLHPDDTRVFDAGSFAPGQAVGPLAIRWVRKDGSLLYTEQKFWVTGDAGGSLVLEGVARDVTALRVAQDVVRQQLRHSALLQQLAQAIAHPSDSLSIYQAVVVLLEENMPIESCSVHLYEARTDSLRPAARGPRSRVVAAALNASERSEVPMGKSSVEAFHRGESVYVADTRRDATPQMARLAAQGIYSTLAVPLTVDERLFGALAITSRAPNGLSDQERAFLQSLAQHVALAGHQVRLHAALQRSYDELKASYEQSIQVERLKALGELASGMSAGISNSLAAAMLFANVGLKNKALPEEARRCFERVLAATSDATTTLNRLREFHRPCDPAEAFGVVEVTPLVEEAMHALQHNVLGSAAQPPIHVTSDFQARQSVLAVAAEIRDVMDNLLQNAVEAMPDGGEVRIRTWDEPGDVAISVSDSGTGMDESTRNRIFEPYFTTREREGAGLGLSVCWGVLQRHRGRLGVETEPGQGSTFTVRLPARGGADRGLGPSSHRRSSIPPLRILVADDESPVRESMATLLGDMGHTVSVAANGWDALQRFHEGTFDVVVTDLGMPLVSGQEVARDVKRCSPQTPVIMLAEWSEWHDLNPPPHVDLVSRKPPTTQSLEEALHSVLAASGSGPIG